MGRIRVFISHSSYDKTLARRFVQTIEAGIEIGAREIRCTSLPDYALPPGSRVSSTLNREIKGADVVVGLVTPRSLKSSYVLFELGAAWGKGRTTFPVLAKGAGMNRLPVLMKEISVAHLSTTEDVDRVVGNLADALGLGLRPKDTLVYKEASRWLVRVAKPPKRKPATKRVRKPPGEKRVAD